MFNEVNSKDMESKEQETGTIAVSKLSSILKMHNNGLSFNTVVVLNNRIETVSASLWTLFPIGLELAKNPKNQNLIKMRKVMIEQIDKEVKSMIEWSEKYNEIK